MSNAVSGPGTGSPIEGVGSQMLQRMAKLPGCAGAVKVFCDIFHLEVPSTIKTRQVSKAQAKPLHAVTPQPAGVSVDQAVKSASKPPPPPHGDLEKLNDLKKFLAPWDPPERMLQGKSKGDIQKLAAELKKMQGLKNHLAEKQIGKAWVNLFNKLQEAVAKQEKAPEQPAAAPKSAAWGDNKNVNAFGQLQILLQDKFLAIRQSLGQLRQLGPKSREQKIESTGLKEQALSILDNYKQYRALLGYDSMSPEDQKKIDQKIQSSFGISPEIFYEIKELAGRS